MARPRKDSCEPDARRRIIEAFWALLEEYPLRSITIGSVSKLAGCNRTTFYYHFGDMDALVASAIQDELLGGNVLARQLSFVLSGGDVSMARAMRSVPVQRISLAMRAGEMHTIMGILRGVVIGLWEQALCDEGEHLSDDARFAVQFMLHGIMGQLAQTIREGGEVPGLSAATDAFIEQAGQLAIQTVARAQGMDAEEARARLVACSRSQPTSSALPPICPEPQSEPQMQPQSELLVPASPLSMGLAPLQG